MKNLVDYIKESLIMSYDHESLKNRLKKKYVIKDFHDHISKSKVKRFAFTVNEDTYDKIIEDDGFFKLLDFYGYYVTQISYESNNKEYDIHLEPNFGEKCNKFVYDDCDGVVYHVTKAKYLKSIYKNGLIPLEGKTYKQFTKRVFLSCGENNKEILDNIKEIVSQIGSSDYVILRINLKKNKNKIYNVNFYYDTSEDNKHNYIYANAIFFPQYIEEIGKIEDLENEFNSIVKEQIINNKKYIIRNL